MLFGLFQKVFSFGKEGKKDKEHDALSECLSLLRMSRQNRGENKINDALSNIEKIIDILEKERL